MLENLRFGRKARREPIDSGVTATGSEYRQHPGRRIYIPTERVTVDSPTGKPLSEEYVRNPSATGEERPVYTPGGSAKTGPSQGGGTQLAGGTGNQPPAGQPPGQVTAGGTPQQPAQPGRVGRIGRYIGGTALAAAVAAGAVAWRANSYAEDDALRRFDKGPIAVEYVVHKKTGSDGYTEFSGNVSGDMTGDPDDGWFGQTLLHIKAWWNGETVTVPVKLYGTGSEADRYARAERFDGDNYWSSSDIAFSGDPLHEPTHSADRAWDFGDIEVGKIRRPLVRDYFSGKIVGVVDVNRIGPYGEESHEVEQVSSHIEGKKYKPEMPDDLRKLGQSKKPAAPAEEPKPPAAHSPTGGVQTAPAATVGVPVPTSGVPSPEHPEYVTKADLGDALEGVRSEMGTTYLPSTKADEQFEKYGEEMDRLSGDVARYASENTELQSQLDALDERIKGYQTLFEQCPKTRRCERVYRKIEDRTEAEINQINMAIRDLLREANVVDSTKLTGELEKTYHRLDGQKQDLQRLDNMLHRVLSE